MVFQTTRSIINIWRLGKCIRYLPLHALLWATRCAGCCAGTMPGWRIVSIYAAACVGGRGRRRDLDLCAIVCSIEIMPFHAYAFPNRISDAAECVWPAEMRVIRVWGRESGRPQPDNQIWCDSVQANNIASGEKRSISKIKQWKLSLFLKRHLEFHKIVYWFLSGWFKAKNWLPTRPFPAKCDRAMHGKQFTAVIWDANRCVSWETKNLLIFHFLFLITYFGADTKVLHAFGRNL